MFWYQGSQHKDRFRQLAAWHTQNTESQGERKQRRCSLYSLRGTWGSESFKNKQYPEMFHFFPCLDTRNSKEAHLGLLSNSSQLPIKDKSELPFPHPSRITRAVGNPEAGRESRASEPILLEKNPQLLFRIKLHLSGDNSLVSCSSDPLSLWITAHSRSGQRAETVMPTG